MVDQSDITSALPDYEVERELGKGGMGIVFLGRHARLGRLVAIKELPPTFAADPHVRERFSTEARTLATLSHPHIVPIYDYVERDGLCLIVMEELPGGTVWDRFTTTGLTPPTACAVVLACCAALQHAHDKGVLHLDVKPDNLMFARDSAIKVTDFGISRVLSGDQTLGTVDGQVLGTPAYMSPEQARGDELTPKSDVYSAGVMLYELLSGHLPWAGAESATDLLLKRLREDPRPLGSLAPQVPPALAAVVMKAIEREPEARYARAEDFGVAVATACADAWGPNWLDLAGVAIIGSDRLSIAARTTRTQPVIVDPDPKPPAPTTTSGTGPAPATTAGGVVSGESRTAPETTAGSVVGSESRTAPETVAGSVVGSESRAPETTAAARADAPAAEPATTTPAPLPDAAPMQFAVVRAAGSEPRIEGANLNQLDRSAFVDVAKSLGQPVHAGRFFALAALFVIAAIAIPALMFGAPTRSGTIKRGDVTIGGADIARGRPSFDLTHDLAIRVRNPAFATFSSRATLKLSDAGAPIASMSTSLAHGAGVFKPGTARYLAAGLASAQLELHGGTKLVAHETFPAAVNTSWYLTALGLGGVIVVLAGFAYFEGALRPFRRGRFRVASLIACGISTAVMALGVVAVLTALGHADPSIPGLIVAAGCSAVAGGLFAVGVRRRALRRGVKRAVQRAQTAVAAG